MDREKLMKQAQVLRNKRHARRVNQNPEIRRGVIRLEKPLAIPHRPQESSMAVPNQAEIRRQKQERILAQRKRNIALKSAVAKQNASRASRSPGCSGCRRKRGK